MKKIGMKYFLLSAALIFGSSILHAQPSTNDRAKKFGLRVGDKMPNIPLGSMINNYTGKTKFSDFKGKLIILDFWTTSCTNCMAAFPKMSELQKEFDDQIQIILVNSFENSNEIKERLLKQRKAVIIPNNLPCITNAESLRKLFPHRYVPHHVWVDEDGVVRLIGSSFNTHEQKIRELLAGNKISYISNSNLPNTDLYKQNPVFSLINTNTENLVQYSSFFTKYNDDFANAGAKCYIEKKMDSISGVLRNCYVNMSVLELYDMALKRQVRKMQVNDIYTGNEWPRYLLLVKDTTRYTTSFIPGLEITDLDYRKCSFTYEQILPMNVHEHEAREYMLQDLNRFFGALYGVEGRIEKRKIFCYVLVRTSEQDKLNKAKTNSLAVIDQNNKKLKHYIDRGLKSVLNSISLSIFKENRNIFLDETGYSGKVNMLLPDSKEIHSLEDLRNALKPYDLDVLKQEREIEMVVIKENDDKRQ